MIHDDLAATLLNSSPDGLLLVDAAGTIVVANKSASRIFGYDIDDLVGTNVDALVPSSVRDSHHRHRAHFADAPTSRPMGTGLHLFAQHADGATFPVEISLSPVTLEGTVHTIATVRDIAERQESLARVALLKDRERIARDLHDMVIQRLFAAGMSLQAVTSSAKPPSVAERIADVINELDDTIRELRSAIFHLGQPDVTRSLSSHVAELIDDRARNLGFIPSLTIDGDVDDVPDYIGEQLVATLIEALSNVARHADASSVSVEIDCTDGRLALTVTDNGAGITSPPKTKGGISNMMWRAAELGGACAVSPGDPNGTRLAWHVPV